MILLHTLKTVEWRWHVPQGIAFALTPSILHHCSSTLNKQAAMSEEEYPRAVPLCLCTAMSARAGVVGFGAWLKTARTFPAHQ